MSKNEIVFIAIDFQRDFTDSRGKCYCKGDSVHFVKSNLIPFFREKALKTLEIVSDYRRPRNGLTTSCDPNDWGFVSEVPDDVKHQNIWVKAMHNPIWVRENGGSKLTSTDFPYPDPKGFSTWVSNNIGSPTKDQLIILYGLTLEVCVLAVAQELYYRGYQVKVLYEATDPMNERLAHKDCIVFHSSLSVYAEVIHYDEMKQLIEQSFG